MRAGLLALLLSLVSACGGSVEKEHTATSVRGGVADPPPCDAATPDVADAGCGF